MTMLDKLAAAIEKAIVEDGAGQGHGGADLISAHDVGGGIGREISVDGALYPRLIAKAVLVVLRNPDEAMIEAAADASYRARKSGKSRPDQHQEKVMHRAMIDAILNEESPPPPK